MRKFLFALCLAAAPVSVHAQQTEQQVTNVDMTKLSEEQKAALQTIANQMSEKKTDTAQMVEAVQNLDYAKIKGWAEAGSEAGKAVGNFAREIGLVAKDFLNTFVGQATFLLVFMNYGGGALSQFIFDIFAFVLLTPFFIWFMWRLFQRYVLRLEVTYTTAYNKNTFLRWLGFNKTVKTVKAAPPFIYETREDRTDFSWLISAVTLVAIFALSGFFFDAFFPTWSTAS